MQGYDGIVFPCAILMACLYVYLGTLAGSRTIAFVSPAIVGALAFGYAIAPWRVVG
jgi:hypothetical protein